jgi:hypothetical protein
MIGSLRDALRTDMRPIFFHLLALAGIIMLPVSPSVAQSVNIEGSGVNCSTWTDGRKTNRSQYFENYSLGFLDGMTMATQFEFWQADGNELRPSAVFAWIDNYCKNHPLDALTVALAQLYEEKSHWKPIVLPPRRN